MKMSKLFTASLAAAIALVMSPGHSWAEGDAAIGKKVFARCKSCHTAEKGGQHRVGPNLFGVVGRTCGSSDFPRYSPGMRACAEKGTVWDATHLTRYIVDASKFLEEMTGKKGRGMTPQRLDDKQLADVIAYLDSLH
ncbi:Cytochrome c [invertebrate metagenome]|uniref:Cytochrome c n=1 Tax=invertebrate metagenome TaxID=1711999 RepID=A0A484H7Y0_9ZZZZ